MTVLYNADISGSGIATFSATRVQFVEVRIDDPGYEARPLDVSNPDFYLRIGWFSLGATNDLVDTVERTYWDAPVWIDFLSFRWTPRPQAEAYPIVEFGVWADSFRWALKPGAEGRVLVYGY